MATNTLIRPRSLTVRESGLLEAGAGTWDVATKIVDVSLVLSGRLLVTYNATDPTNRYLFRVRTYDESGKPYLYTVDDEGTLLDTTDGKQIDFGPFVHQSPEGSSDLSYWLDLSEARRIDVAFAESVQAVGPGTVSAKLMILLAQ